MVKEPTLLRQILREHGARTDVRLFRNNVAQAWVGKAQRISAPTSMEVHPGDVIIRNARPLHAGLCAGSSDLIGWRTLVTDLGPVAQFVACEVKTGRQQPTKAQQAFLKAVATFGGVGVVARSPDDLLQALEKP